MENQIFELTSNNIGSSDLLSTIKSHTNLNFNIPSKMFDETNVFKPKGLTMRSASHFNTNDRKSPHKKMMLKYPSNKMNLRPLSPGRRLLLQKQSARFEKKKEMFLAKIKETQKIVSQHNCIKPAQKQCNYLEPEVLSHDLDSYNYDDMNLDSPFIEFPEQDEDEGFISDSELIPVNDDLSFIFSEDEDDDYIRELRDMDFDVPELSDLEDLYI